MAETLTVQITAKDGATQVFKAVASSAQQVGKAVEDAGRKGDAGFDKVEKGAKDAERAVGRVSDEAKRATVSFSDFNIAITAIGAGLLKAGDMALQQQQTIIGLESAYGDAADEMLRFADQMAETTIFNDDDILRGERYFATLRNNYDLTIQEIQELMQVTADLASAYGTNFEDASSRVTAAIRGEGEAAEYLGLTMNQQAIDRENLTLTMTNQEAAQFRLNALYEQTGVYQGTAQRLTETEVGTRAKLTNAVQDNAQAFAATIGPITSLTAGMALTASGIGSMIGGMGRLVTAARNSQRAMAALTFVANPLSLALGVVVAGGYALYQSFNDADESAQNLDVTLQGLEGTLEQMRLSGDAATSSLLTTTIAEIDAIREVINASNLEDMNALLGTQFQSALEFDTAAVRDDLQRVVELSDDATQQITDNLAGMTAEQQRVYLQWVNDLLDSAVTTAEDSNLDDILEKILITPVSQVPGVVDPATESLTGFLTLLHTLPTAGPAAGNGITTAAEALDFLNKSIADGSVNLAEFTQLRADLNRAVADGSITDARAAEIIIEYANSVGEVTVELTGLGEAAAGVAVAVDDMIRRLDGLAGTAATGAISILNAGLTEMIGNFEDAGESAGGMLDGVTERARGELEELIGYAEEFIASMQELAGIDMADRVNMAGLGTDATMAAAAINDVGAALDSVLTIYGAIDAMGQRMSQAGGIVDALFGPDGDPSDGVGPLRDVYDAGLIGQEQFNSAIEDGIQIQQAAADSQLYLNKMRADQLPILNDTTQAYLDQIKAISELDANEQMVALGWMDSGMQGRVEQFTGMISLMNNFGDEGEAAMQQVIDGIVATDPVLTAMLEDLGLIERQLDGSYTLSLDAEGAVSDIERLTASIDALTLALGGTPPSYDIDVTGIEDVEAADALIRAMGDHEVTVSFAVEGEDRAKEALRNALGLVGGGEGDGPGITVPVNLQVPTDLPPLPDFDPVVVPVSFDWGGAAGAVGGAVSGALGAFGDGEDGATITITAIDNASATIEEVINAASSVPESEQVAVSAPGASETTSALNEVTAAANAIPEIEVITVVASGASEAAAALYDVANAANSIPSSVTTTVTTNHVSTGIPYMPGTNILPGGRHGGMPGYAMGGVLFEGGEAGMELAHFATGGVALMPRHAIYEAPRGTYIEPANSVGPVGGVSVHLTIQGDVYGVDNLTDRVGAAVIDALASESTRYNRATGRTA